ncbi:LysM peptidoglycan-binding domain-containing protein [Chondromyces apiculatus]|nr:LysM peptidoglycan-binding domain-containing protein [Chondromyces apiculatus]
MKHPTTLVALALASAPAASLAQEVSVDSGAGAEQPATPGVTVIQVPTQAPQVIVPGYPPPGFDPNSHLPSSSRGSTDTSRPSDGFDLNRGSVGEVSVRGNANGSYVVEGQYLPEMHSVRRGDTLWDISGRYYQNPYSWPQLWAMNPQLQNPHWIYPGDRLRLREQGEANARSGLTANMPGGLQLQNGRVPPQTIFLHTVGWVDDQKKDTWGTLVGSPEDQMLLSEGDDVYLQMSKEDDDGQERTIALGQELTIFQPIKRVGSGKASGDLVAVRGTVRVDRYNPKTRMVRGRILESLDVIERGARVGAVQRRFDVVSPRKSDKDLEAKILASLYPHHMFGQNQVVFIDKGKEEGVAPGMRFFAVRRGDKWAQNIDAAGQTAKLRPRVDDDRAAIVDKMQYGVDEDLLPDETYAEMRVLSVRDHTCVALVTAALHEVERNAALVMRVGY